jgi:two-component system sensor histidine kinase and response regulator WspE
MSAGDSNEIPLFDLFRLEAETQTQALSSGLLALERDPGAADQLERCMRAAHSLKGAAGIVGLEAGVRLAHALEDCFVAARERHITLSRTQIGRLLQATDLLMQIATSPEHALSKWADGRGTADVDACLTSLTSILESPEAAESTHASPVAGARWAGRDNSDRALRVTAENLNRVLGLVSELLVESRSLKPLADSLLRLKRMQYDVGSAFDGVYNALQTQSLSEDASAALDVARRAALDCEEFLSRRLDELDAFERRSIDLSNQLYDEALACRMRPFADGVQSFPRMVRDLAHRLGKEATLEIVGEMTQVDRDILVKLDSPLSHLLSNAVVHGLESPQERRAAGKRSEGVVRLQALHNAGMLEIVVSDDGSGVDLDKVRARVVERNLIGCEAAATLSDAELFEFLFLPGFTMTDTLTEVSGRGVGMDVVREMVRRARGTIRVTSEAGKGTRFVLQLPVTLSVIRSLVVDVAGEPYAFPLVSIVRTLVVPKTTVEHVEGRQYLTFDGRPLGLVAAHQILEAPEPHSGGDDQLSVIVLGDASRRYGVIVDRFLGERELMIRPLDPRLGRSKNIAAGALMKDGSPVLIVDVEDLMCSMNKLAAVGRLSPVSRGVGVKKVQKRVLVVDDSLTVREVERKLLSNRGYEVEVAVDGIDGWNAVRTGEFDLVVTDIDMPRMNGIELVTLINRDPDLKAVPVMVVSYKDRDEDRQRGLKAGAAYYLTKKSFDDDTLIQAVVDLIGEAGA